MKLPTLFSTGDRETPLAELDLPLHLDAFFPGGPWEVELGFGKGRYLLAAAEAHPERRYLGVEMVSKYYRLARQRGRRRGLGNLLLVRGEALYLLSAVLPGGFAHKLHVYFPDPWPKARHHKRRLFDPETVDLVLGVLRPGGELLFATDHLDYGEVVVETLRRYPGLEVELQDGPWPDGARTNYEAKFVAEGRPILRLVARRPASVAGWELHPAGRAGVVAATARREE
jgi:tRNA (guanine-N7-)-methyltransferase